MFVSITVLTSVLIAPFSPSFLKTAYPRIGQPPSSDGSLQPSVRSTSVEVTLIGAYILEGATQA
jgi:hypothetical protein